jgi:hypothetical protein
MADSKTFICRPEDDKRLVLKSAVNLAEVMLEGGWVDVAISRHVEKKTPPQHRTVWLWCTEAAIQLSAMGRMTGKGGKWSKDDVYEIVFKGRFMPKIEKVMPDGAVEYVPVGLSAKPTIEQVSMAMEKFQAWAIELGIELTQPEELLR